MQQNQRNGVEVLTYVMFGFDRHNALCYEDAGNQKNFCYVVKTL